MKLKDKAISEKRTTRNGRVIGLKDRAKISIAVNDEDRTVSRLWELVKKRNSRKKITAAETARRVFLKGLMVEIEEMSLASGDAESKSNYDCPDLFQ